MACFSKVPKTFRARKAICKITNRLFWKANLLTCFQGNKKKNNCEVWRIKCSLFLSYKGNFYTRKWPVKFRDFWETPPWTRSKATGYKPYRYLSLSFQFVTVLTTFRKIRSFPQLRANLDILSRIKHPGPSDTDVHRPQTEPHDLKAMNSDSELGFFSLKIFWFGCNIASAFSRACSLDLIFVHIWA